MHLFTAREQVEHKLHTAFQQMFKVIQHEQQRFVFQVAQQLFDRCCRAAQAQIKGRGDFNRNRFGQVRISAVDLGQFNQPNAIRIMLQTAAGYRSRQTRFTHAALPHQRNQPTPRLIQAFANSLLCGDTPKKLIVWHGQIVVWPVSGQFDRCR